jgi:phage terminase large subunit-like protein
MLAIQGRKNRNLPEIRMLEPHGKSKLIRALPSIIMGENGKIYLPKHDPNWLDAFIVELAAFTGVKDDEDDQVDVLAYACLEVQSMQPDQGDDFPEILHPGKARW